MTCVCLFGPVALLLPGKSVSALVSFFALSCAEVKVMFSIPSPLARWVRFWVSKLKCESAVLAVSWHQKNLRSNRLYSFIVTVLRATSDDEKIEMIATRFISFDKFWKLVLFIIIPNIKCFIYLDSPLTPLSSSWLGNYRTGGLPYKISFLNE